jgi:hypothetical protein
MGFSYYNSPRLKRLWTAINVFLESEKKKEKQILNVFQRFHLIFLSSENENTNGFSFYANFTRRREEA